MHNLCMKVYNKSGSKTKKHFRACTQGSLRPGPSITNLTLRARLVIWCPGRKLPLIQPPLGFLVYYESMVSLVLRQYMRGENGTESLMGFFFKCRRLRSVLLIQIGKQNVEIIDK